MYRHQLRIQTQILNQDGDDDEGTGEEQVELKKRLGLSSRVMETHSSTRRFSRAKAKSISSSRLNLQAYFRRLSCQEHTCRIIYSDGLMIR